MGMNPNYLLRDELEYELHIRGIHTEGDVHFLRKIFRSVISEAVPIRPEIFGEFELRKLVVGISLKVSELEGLVIQPNPSQLHLCTRVKTRIKHLTDHLLRIISSSPLPACISVSEIVVYCPFSGN
jgi:hypothetical protein